MHLTNYSINKNSATYLPNDDPDKREGHKWTLAALWQHFAENGIDSKTVWDRIKDMVIRGGENIYPREIEESLHKHPNIIEAQVVGVPDHRMGEELCAWIRVKDGETVTEEEVKAFCKGEVRYN